MRFIAADRRVRATLSRAADLGEKRDKVRTCVYLTGDKLVLKIRLLSRVWRRRHKPTPSLQHRLIFR
jgi:hypothetical protein